MIRPPTFEARALLGREVSHKFLSFPEPAILDRQIRLATFIPLLSNPQLWIMYMVGYHCSGLRKSALRQK